MSKADQKEVRVDIRLPRVGFRKVMYFDRFRIVREEGVCLVQFGLVASSMLLDHYSCVLTQEMLKNNRASLLNYLERIGQPAERPTPWQGLGEYQTEVADVISMALQNQMAETTLFVFSVHATNQQRISGISEPVEAQPLALLRSSLEVQKQLIRGLYEE